MAELDEVLDAAVEARRRTVRGLSPDDLAGLAARVRRRRLRRHVLEAAVAVPVVVVLGFGAWFGLGRSAPLPETTRPAPTSGPTATPDTSGAVLLPEEDGLPVLHVLPDGLLEKVGPGWVLGIYQPTGSAGAGPAPTGTPVAQVVVLAAPDGTAYLVERLDGRADLVAGATWRNLTLIDWRPGSTTALVQAAVQPAPEVGGDASAYLPLYDLDLRTGGLTPSSLDLGLGQGEAGPQLVSFAQGEPVWVEGSQPPTMTYRGARVTLPELLTWRFTTSPDGTLLLAGDTVVDLETATVVGTLPRSGADGYCTAVSWWAADALLAVCSDIDPSLGQGAPLGAHPRLVAFSTDGLRGGAAPSGTLVRALGEGDPMPFGWADAWMAEHEVLIVGRALTAGTDTGNESCPVPVLLRDGDLQPLPAGDPRAGTVVFRSASAEGRVLTETLPCRAAGASLLSSSERAGGASTELLGLPLGRAPDGGGWSTGLTSWVLGR